MLPLLGNSTAEKRDAKVRKLIQRFDFRFIISSVLLMPWKSIKNVTDANEKIYELENVDVEPRPAIGKDNLNSLLQDIVREESKYSGGLNCFITFLVHKNGEIKELNTSIKDMKFASKISKALSSNGRWIPGLHNGDVVNVKMKINIQN